MLSCVGNINLSCVFCATNSTLNNAPKNPTTNSLDKFTELHIVA